jgi:arylsulfatase A-like enzyme
MKNTLVKTLAATALATLPAWAQEAAKPARQPNVIIILADDVGYGDFSCYGAKQVQTPNVDRLAKEGMRFTDAHATAAVCTPTRYALLTGQYAWRNKAGSAILSGEAPLAIDPAKATTPSIMQKAGYTTGIVGKWHIGLGAGDLDYNKEIKPGPREVGFDYAFYFPATNDRVPCVYIEDRRVVGLDPADPIQTSYQGKIGNEPTGKEHPELLQLKYRVGHDGTIVNGISRIGFMSGGKAAWWKDEDIADTLTKKATGFIEKNQAKPFFLYFATHDIHAPRWPNSRFRGTSNCGLRGDAIREFDWSVGEILATLDRLKLADNTLIIVSSDNGGTMNDGYMTDDIRGANGHRCNAPLRGEKGSLYEGGHREPLLARWPGQIKPGTQSGELIGLVDLAATCAAITGQTLPADAAPDSFNILPALLGGKSPRDHLVLQSNGIQRQALRQGQWKFIPAAPKGNGQDELYDLANDLGETANLAAKNPEKLKEMQDRLAKLRAAPFSRPK